MIDDLVQEIFEYQREMYPDQDPGDLAIEFQDDYAAVFVVQDGWISPGPILAGTAEEALDYYLQSIKQERVTREEHSVEEYLLNLFDLEAALVTDDKERFESAVQRLRHLKGFS